jgi:tape measure domain-containing protein
MAESVSLTAVLSVRDKMSAGLRSAGAAAGGLGGRMKSLVGTGAALQVGMKAVNAAVGAVTSSMGSAVSRVDTLNQFPKLMKQMGLASESAANSVKKDLVDAIDGLPTSLDEIVSSTKNLAVLTGDLDTAADTAVALNDAFLASGSSSADASRGLTQYSQMLAKGKVDQQAWNTLCETMGYGLDKTAKSLLGNEANQRDLYSALQDGSVTFDEFNRELIKLDKAEGGFASTARTASVGIATSFTNIKTAITAGLANSINALDEAMKSSGVKWLEGGIAGALNNVKTAVSKAFEKINAAIASIDVQGIVAGLTPAFKVLKKAAELAGDAVSGVFKLLNGHAEGAAKAATAVVGLAIAYGGYKKISGIIGTLRGAGKATETLGKGSKLASKGVSSLKGAFGSFVKMAGVAAILASLALLANTLAKLGALGTTAVTPLVTFGAIVAGLAAVFAKIGVQLQASALGIAVFAAAVSAMAYTMAQVAQTGTDGAIAMGVFGGVVAGLAVVFALIGPALDAAALGMVAFGAAVLMAGIGLGQAAPFVTALTGLIKQLGDTLTQAAGAIASAVSQIVTSISGSLCEVIDTAASAFGKLSDGVTKVVDAISGGLASVLNAIAGVIESIGASAKNAGKGFKYVAEGISEIAALPILSTAKALGTVAAGIGSISSKGKNIGSVASGVKTLSSALSSLTGKASAAGKAAGTGFATPIKSGMNQAETAAKQAVSKIDATLKNGASQAKTAGTMISQGFASGMLSYLGTIETAASRMVSAANKAIEAKAKIHSPSKVTRELGTYYSEGWVNGIKSRLKEAHDMAADLVSIPQISTSRYAMAGAGTLNSDYIYGGSRSVTVEVPVVMDGKEIARVTAPYNEAEQNKRQMRANRKKGLR